MKHLYTALKTIVCSLVIIISVSGNARSQALVNMDWSATGALQASMSSLGLDSLKWRFLPGNQIEFVYTYSGGGGNDTTYGLWWQVDASHFRYADTSGEIIGAVCSADDTVLVPYTINADTLTMGTTTDGCVTRAALFNGSKWLNPSLGTGETTLRNDAVIYPNPVTGMLSISLLSPADPAGTSVALYSTTGAVVRTEAGFVGNTSIQLNMKDVAPGVYYLRITGSGNKQLIHTRMIIKE